MERVADKVGLRTDLMATFHENAEIVNDVLTLAYYSFATGNSWSRAARWQKLEKAPSSRELTPMTITRLTHSISETERMNLFKYRADRLDKDELCAVDSIRIRQFARRHQMGPEQGARPSAADFRSRRIFA